MEREREFYEAIRKHYQSEADKFEELNGVKLDVDALVNANKVISKQGHSGFSAAYVIGWIEELAKKEEIARKSLDGALKAAEEDPEDEGIQCMVNNQISEIWDCVSECNIETKIALAKLLNDKPLTPLTGKDEEWNVYELYTPKGAKAYYVNNRCRSVYKVVYPGEPNDIEIAIDHDLTTYTDNGGKCFFTTGRFGQTQITFPYEPGKKKEVNLFEVYYEDDEVLRSYILTDPETIKKQRENYEKNRICGCVIKKEEPIKCDVVKVADPTVCCCEPTTENK